MSRMSTVLSVNLNKIAVLRNSRGGSEPSMLRAAQTVVDAGGLGITLHPRPDCRHVRPQDVLDIAAWRPEGVELNLEGNPFAGARPGYPGFIELVEAARPQQVTLVPDDDGQITSDHGFDLVRDAPVLAPIVARLHALGARVSAFVDPGSAGAAAGAAIGLDRIEVYTGPYAQAFAASSADTALDDCALTASDAQTAGLGVNAGHDLSQANLGLFVSRVPGVAEVSIGHALIGEALYAGLDATVRAYLRILAEASFR
jgi:pyridoxine 5-phosphate synthase